MTYNMDLTADQTHRTLLLDAVEWRLLGLLMERPCDANVQQIAALSSETSDPQLRRAAELSLAQASRGLYDTTFGPGGPAAPREVSHRATLEPGSFLAELHAYYDAFAYRASTDDPADHVAVQVGFIGYLRLKQLYASARGEKEQAALAHDAAESFIAEHLRLIGAPLAAALAHSDIEYLALAAEALVNRVGKPAAPPALSLPLAEQEDSEHPDACFPCGA